MAAHHAYVALPGDIVPAPEQQASTQPKSKPTPLRIGPGLRQVAVMEGETQVVASKCGLVKHQKPASMWIDTNLRRVSFMILSFLLTTLVCSYHGRAGDWTCSQYWRIAYSGHRRQSSSDVCFLHHFIICLTLIDFLLLHLKGRQSETNLS